MSPIHPADTPLLIRHATKIAIGGVTLLMLFAAALFRYESGLGEAAKGWVSHTYEVIGHIALLSGKLKDAELGHRGFIITDNKDFLEPYENALRDGTSLGEASPSFLQHRSIAQELAFLRKLTADNPAQQGTLDKMDDATRKLLNYFAATIQQRTDEATGPARSQIDLQRGKALMDQLRALALSAEEEESRLLLLRTDVDRTTTQLRDRLTLMTLAIWLYQRSRAHAQAQMLIYTRQLEAREEELEATNKDVEAFTYAVSHDLRAPLRAISNFSQAVLEDYGPKLDQEGQRMPSRMQRATVTMDQIIEDLLKLAHIGSAPLLYADVNLSEIAAEIGETLRERVPERRLRMSIQSGIHAQCDGRLVAVALTNLLENAWKFTSRVPAAEIQFGEERSGGRSTYFVRDNGAGFEPTYSDKLFKPFQRLHTTDQFPGTGIGLATVARVIRAHSGKIWAESAPGEGAKFCFQLGDAAHRS